MSQLVADIGEAQGEVTAASASAEKQAAALERRRARLAGLEGELAGLRRLAVVDAEVKAAEREKAAMVARRAEITTAKENLEAGVPALEATAQFTARELAEAEDVLRDRLAAVARVRYQPARTALEGMEAVERLRREGRFRGEVWGPTLLQLGLTAPVARQMETIIPGWLRYSFIVTTPEDYALLSDVRVRGGQALSVCQVRMDTVTSTLAERMGARGDVVDRISAGLWDARHGGARVDWAHHLLDCPDFVKVVLLREAALDANIIIYGDADYTAAYAGLKVTLPAAVTVTTESASFRSRASMYGGAPIVSRSPNRPSEVLHHPLGSRATPAMRAAAAAAAAALEAARGKLAVLAPEDVASRHVASVASATAASLAAERQRIVDQSARVAAERTAVANEERRLADRDRHTDDARRAVETIRTLQATLLQRVKRDAPSAAAALVRAEKAIFAANFEAASVRVVGGWAHSHTLCARTHTSTYNHLRVCRQRRGGWPRTAR